MAGQIGPAVVSDVTSRVVSKVIKMFNKQAAVDEKLRKLELLCIKIHSTVEASDKHRITNTYLLKWQEKLKEAATEGDEVLFSFHWRTLNEASRKNNHQIGKPSALTYTKTAISSTVQYFHNTTKMLLSLDKDVEKLNCTVEKLEKLSTDTEEFLRLVEFEAFTEDAHAPTKRKKPVICDSSALQQEEHQPSNRKRAFDSLLDPNKMLVSVKRATRVRFFSFWIV